MVQHWKIVGLKEKTGCPLEIVVYDARIGLLSEFRT